MPRLIVMRGANHRFHDVDGSLTRIGTHPENDLVIEGDTGVSRRHCVVRRNEGGYVLRDNASRNGTFLNGTRIEEAPIAYGDRVRIGQTIVIFGARDRGAKADVSRRLSNSLILQEINKELNTETDINVLLELIIDTAIHLIDAERGFLIQVVEGTQLEFTVARNIDYEVVRSPEFKISNTVIRKVVKTGEPVLTSNAQLDLRDMKSIAGLGLRALMCVPLRVKSRILGVIYLDSQSPDSQFDDEGRDLLMAFSDQAAIALENARLLREARDKEAILSELRVASNIQLALLPREDPDLPTLEVSGRMKTAREVGGDYFDYIWGPPMRGSRSLYVAIGDVSGKGVPAGLVMVMARSILRSLAGRGAPPRELLREGNRLLKQDLKPGMFMSLLLAYLDTGTGRMLLAGCGHERPLVYRAKAGRVEKLEVGGLVLGVVPDIGPHIDEARVDLEPGDQILFYTDGATEAVDPGREQYGVRRLHSFLTRRGHLKPQGLVEALLSDLADHQGGAEQHDDITLIAVRRPPAS